MIAQDAEANDDKVEPYLRANRRALVAVLVIVLFLAATVMAVALSPSSWLGQWPLRFPLLFPIGVLLAFMGLRLSLRPHKLRADAPEAKVALNDEFRRMNLLRAERLALIAVLIAQAPLGFLFMHAPVERAVFGMAGTTVALGVSAVIVLFLIFDRE